MGLCLGSGLGLGLGFGIGLGVSAVGHHVRVEQSGGLPPQLLLETGHVSSRVLAWLGLGLGLVLG